MRHARPDYDRFQDPLNKIPQDEPVFLLRGQDRFAAETVRHYATLVGNSTEVNLDLVRAVTQLADWMDAWPKHKSPDL